MPRYDYECPACGIMEIAHSIHDDALTVCPTCNSNGLERVILRCPVMSMPDAHWEDENGGRGRYISQLAEKQNDPNAYCRSLNEIPEKARKAGFTRIERA